MEYMYKVLINPFVKYLDVFIILFVLYTFNVVYEHISIFESLKFSLYLTLNGFLLSYITTLTLSMLPKLMRRIMLSFIVLFFSIFFIVEFYCIDYLKAPFNEDFAMLILATNPNEASEFMQSMIPLDFVFRLCVFIAFIGLLCYVINKITIRKYIVLLMLFVLAVSGSASIYNLSSWNQSVLKRIYRIVTFEAEEEPDSIRKYFTNPMVDISQTSPLNMVVVIGESFSKYHSSIYGYEKNTNPLLSQLQIDSSLIVFDSVASAGLTTMISFKYMMSDYSPNSDNKEWYKHRLLLDVLKSAGYRTHWISNHSKIGRQNNVTKLLAEACDDNSFTGNVTSDFSTIYDEQVISIADSLIPKLEKQKYNCYFFHLMGSHFKFDFRYPKNFDVFTVNDYLDKPEHQRATLASYDNSILYNDKVVYEIIQLFKEKDAIIIYLADHGLDVYNSSEYYAAHGKINDPISAKYGSEIPFFIYPTELYKQNNPDVVSELKESRNQSIRTDSLMNIIMNIAKIRYK